MDKIPEEPGAENPVPPYIHAMRFLHLADIHLDAPFAGRSRALRERLREASREALRRAVDLALDETLDAVLIAGDLFDGERLSFETERLLTSQFERLNEGGITVVYGAGNHDPGAAGLRAHEIAWPENVVAVLDAEPRRTVITGPDGDAVGVVTAAGHPTASETRDLSRAFPAPEGDVAEVALLHTQVRSSRDAEAHEPYAPSELERLRAAGYDYWALGHVHLRQALSEEPPIHYPGSLLGRTLRETGARGGLVVDLSDRKRPSVEFRELAPLRRETLTVDGLENATDLDTLVDRVEQAWHGVRDEAGAPPDTEWLLRVDLTGPTPLWRQLEVHEEVTTATREIRGRLGVLEVRLEAAGVHPVLSPEEYRRRTDVLGEALRLLERVRRDEDRLRGVAPAELAGFAGGEGEALDTYVRERLRDAEAELLARMVRHDEESGA